ncbi:hypothetical protein N7476_001317 [Penicillium atrosanguineum]|uniref:Zn(2)-C6 fungal-type domain-containing protein n=1 Tax=Penicillium atrosanguineum TaxID=1132637 RepID=A0A9W9UDK6_9EURO|nr:hypothetical protein N7476_001317 [Penicillium atrosanguineum]
MASNPHVTSRGSDAAFEKYPDLHVRSVGLVELRRRSQNFVPGCVISHGPSTSPEGMRSYSGCLTCKGRKLKCDEAKPACGNCNKASRECTYGESSIFRSQKIGSTPGRKRRKRNLRENVPPTIEESPTWVDVPTELSFVQIEDPWAPDSSKVVKDGETAIGTEEAHVDGEQYPTGANDLSVHHEAPESVHFEPSPLHHAPILDHSTPREDTSTVQVGEEFDIDIFDKVLVSYLLRHFKQGPGQWMDLFDSSAYFSSKALVIAASNPLLKSAVCALSAKHLRHICQTTSQAGEGPGIISRYPGLPWTNVEIWRYNSAKYYDQALGHLKTAVDVESYMNNLSEKEEMLAAVAILCAFELMDAPGSAWRAHLSALPLFNDRTASMSDLSTVVIPRTAVKGPIFWSLARQDLLCAFISETQTRLDLKDIRLWQNAGLATDEHGELLPYSPLDVMENQNSSGFEEDMKSNELTWILGKLANHLTAGDALTPEHNALPRHQRLSIGLNQECLLERWNLLMTDLGRWHDSLPASFCPTARTRRLGHASPGLELSFNTFEQIWFDLPLCAATVQSYHQAKILLLANEPQESTAIRSTVSARLRSYRHALREVIYHAREICGISLANSTDPFRVNSVQALFVAGQVFQEQHEQDAVIEILSGIERDLGWTTRYHVAKLNDEWARGREGNHIDRDEQGHDRNWFIS